MARTKKESGRWSKDVGQVMGRALGEGLAQGMRGSMEKLREELAPLGSELAAMLIREVEQSAAESLPESDAELGVRRCSEPGCIRRAIARGMCRRHYARQTYREKKERQAAEGKAPAPRGRPRLQSVPALESAGEGKEKAASSELKSAEQKVRETPKLVLADSRLQSGSRNPSAKSPERQSKPARTRQPRQRPVEKPVEKKVVAPVPPMVRKRDSQGASAVLPGKEGIPAALKQKQPELQSSESDSTAAVPSPGEAPTLVLDQVAKFFGRK